MNILITGATGNVGQAILQHVNFSGANTFYLTTRKKADKPIHPLANDYLF